MVSPYIREQGEHGPPIVKTKISEELIDWVYDNRYDTATTKEEIKENYTLFCKKMNIDE